MAYLPVEFELSEFSLFLPTKAAAAFHKRMKELGFTSQDSKGMMIYTRHDSRLCAMIGQDYSLNFLQDFYDHTPGGTIYAVLEKLCIQFKGTMIGKYSIPVAGKEWGIRISQGMNLSGRDDVGQRDKVQEEEVTAPSGATFQNSSTLVPGTPVPAAQPQASQAPASGSAVGSLVGSGQVSAGQPGQSHQGSGLTAEQRSKLYDMHVEDQFAEWVAQNPNASSNEAINEKLRLVKEFEKKFPKEQEKEAPQEVKDFCTWVVSTQNSRSDILLEEEDFDDMVYTYINEQGGNLAYADVAAHLYELMEAAGPKSPDANGNYRYTIKLPGTASTLTLIAEEGKLEFSWLDKYKSAQTPQQLVNTIAAAPANPPAKRQVKGPAPMPSFNNAHAASYSHVANATAAPSTISIPAGYVAPEIDLQQALRFASATLYKMHTSGCGTTIHTQDIMAHIRAFNGALNMIADGAPHEDIYEYLYNVDPSLLDVSDKVDYYKDWFFRLNNTP